MCPTSTVYNTLSVWPVLIERVAMKIIINSQFVSGSKHMFVHQVLLLERYRAILLLAVHRSAETPHSARYIQSQSAIARTRE